MHRSVRTHATGSSGSRSGLRASALRFGGALVALLLLGAPATRPAHAAGGVDLIGTWFVLIHYRDVATANPDSDRWEDKVWTFEMKGSRLYWTEYPIVIFEDGSGRFEARAGTNRARVLAAWEPNEAQLAEIAAGPQINSRGSKTKSLRGNAERGYKSSGSLRAQGASVIGYHETWSIDAPTTMPVFTRDDMMGTGRGKRSGGEDENISGRTRYSADEVVGPDEIRGSYVRDENRSGRFRLLRAGAIRGLPKDGKTPNEKMNERIQEQIQREVDKEVERIRERAREGDPEAIQQIKEGMRQERDRRP